MNTRFDFDKEYLKNVDFVIGTDEAGRGSGAGAVFAAAVCFLSIDINIIKMLEKLNDSKQLSEKTREELYAVIIKNSLWAVNSGSVEEIENTNILKTSLSTMKKCVYEITTKLKNENIIILVDGNKKIPQCKYNQEAVVKGDCKSASIAAASIIAKVTRDRYMLELDKEFPMYGWAENKGYMTKQHLAAVDKYGFTKWHRKNFFEKHLNKSNQLSLLNF